MADSYEMDTVRLDRNALKLIAAAAMLVDHTGAIVLQDIMVLRIIGRISFPIFAFFIAEGCVYTKNKSKYLFNLLVFAAVSQTVKVIFNDNDDLNIMVTFAISVLLIYAFDMVMRTSQKDNTRKTICFSLLFGIMIVLIWFLNRCIDIQYGFWGCVTPLIVYTAEYISSDTYTKKQLKLILLMTSLAMIHFVYGGVQIWAYAAILLLMFYSGEKGKAIPKYFFYIFYPVHLILLYTIKQFII